eukprot:1159475-Pelagomonas_calceolata.AAC.9
MEGGALQRLCEPLWQNDRPFLPRPTKKAGIKPAHSLYPSALDGNGHCQLGGAAGGGPPCAQHSAQGHHMSHEQHMRQQAGPGTQPGAGWGWLRARSTQPSEDQNTTK